MLFNKAKHENFDYSEGFCKEHKFWVNSRFLLCCANTFILLLDLIRSAMVVSKDGIHSDINILIFQ